MMQGAVILGDKWFALAVVDHRIYIFLLVFDYSNLVLTFYTLNSVRQKA